jgi:N-formylglutamate deformylase
VDLENEIINLTDWYTDEIFDTVEDTNVVTPFSRIFCDVERFEDDDQEVMSKVGLGILYEKIDSGNAMRQVDPALRKKVIEEYYLPHHKIFEETVDNELARSWKSLIVDCHSFPDTPMIWDLNQEIPHPDFNIGTDELHTPEWFTELSEGFFKENGYSVWIDKPYKGTIVPMKITKTTQCE